MSIEQEVQGVYLPHLTCCIRFWSFVASLFSVAASLSLQSNPRLVNACTSIYTYLSSFPRDFHFRHHGYLLEEGTPSGPPTTTSLLSPDDNREIPWKAHPAG